MSTLIGNNIVHVKSHNRQAILLSLLDAPLSRVELARQLGLSPMTVTNLVNELLQDGWLEAVSGHAVSAEKPRRAGRPRTALQINADAAQVIGVHMGIGAFRVALTNLKGHIIDSRDAVFDIGEDADSVLQKIAAELGKLRGSTHLLGIGFGASGLVNSDLGINVTAPSLGWRDVPIAKRLSELTRLPVAVENNVRAMALGEAYFGQGGTENLAFIFGRIGIAAGIAMNRQLFRGTSAGAGEIGHTIIIPENGERCRCGQHGCLETLVTEPTLRRHLPNYRTIETILAGARNAEPTALRQIERVAAFLSIALINLVNTLNPQRIIMGGLYADAADLFLPILRENVRQRAFGGLGEQVCIEATGFGRNAGVIGAATVALAAHLYSKDTTT